ncbi:hypothetical protein L7F22_003414 [Adiantum nelumboides]|nr:hypothetical protein [Adiantum nelumboides]
MESLTAVVNYILEGEFPKEFTTWQRRKLIKQASTFLWLEGSLYQKGKDLVRRRVPSTNEIPKILKGLHEEACGEHFSHELTLKKVLLAGYFWPSMHADVQHWCRSCHNCQVIGNKRLLYGSRQAIITNGPFEKWRIDAMGPLPRTTNGKLYIIVAIDYMTRWVEVQSVAKVNGKTVSKFVYTHICCRFGTPLEIVFDNGPGFRRGLLTEVCEELKISHRHSTPYNPQSNGLVEKANGIIEGIIKKMVESEPKRWDNFLDGAVWAYITTYRDATQFIPFYLVYGQEALQPIELNIPTIKLTGRQEQNNDEAWIDRLLNLVELEWKREAAYHCYTKKALQLKDKLNEGIKDKEIKEKSLVLRYNNALSNRFDAKFERRWEGPFIVKKAFIGGYYQLMDLNGKEHPRKVNGYRLKPYLSRILPAVFETKQVSKKTKKVHVKIFAADEYSQDLKESFQKIKEAISIAQQKQKAAANKHQRSLAFKENDWVLLKFPKARLRHNTGKNPTGHQKYYTKLAKRYYGPFQILKPINEMAYQLKLPKHWFIHNAFHVSLLKPYKGKPPKETITEDPPEVEGQEEVLQPESVLRHEDKVLRNGKIIRRYLIKFNNYPFEDAKWMQGTQLKDSLHLVNAYNDSLE